MKAGRPTASAAGELASADLRNRGHTSVIHVLSGLAIGGKEAAALRLAQRGIAGGEKHRLLLFDTPFRSTELDFDPESVPVDFVPRGRGIDFGFVLALSRYFGNQRPEAVHCYNDTAIVYVAMARILTSHSFTAIGTFHTWPSHPTSRARRASYWACGRFDSVNAVSRDLRDRLKAQRWAKNCNVISNGVDLAKFHVAKPTRDWRTELRIPNDAVVVGHVARFDEIKRQQDLINAAKLLERTGSRIVVVLVGHGPTLVAVRRLAQASQNVRFVEQTHDMPSFLNSIDVFTLCSAYEAAPLVVLEAMACGLPIVATEVGGIPDYVAAHDTNTCAIMLPVGRPDLLANALQLLEKDSDLRRRLGGYARELAERHCFDREWNAYRALYARGTLS